MNPLGITQWQTWRLVSTDDTFLTDYKAADVTDAVKKKMIGIYPATAIIIRAFGKDTNADDATVVISAWMDISKPKGGGPGHRLWRGSLICGSKSYSHAPLGDGKWGSADTWFDVDTFNVAAAGGYDMAGATRLDSVFVGGTADQESVLLLPTLGYTHLLIEVIDLGGAAEMTEIGFIWRPIRIGEVIRSI